MVATALICCSNICRAFMNGEHAGLAELRASCSSDSAVAATAAALARGMLSHNPGTACTLTMRAPSTSCTPYNTEQTRQGNRRHQTVKGVGVNGSPMAPPAGGSLCVRLLLAFDMQYQ